MCECLYHHVATIMPSLSLFSIDHLWVRLSNGFFNHILSQLQNIHPLSHTTTNKRYLVFYHCCHQGSRMWLKTYSSKMFLFVSICDLSIVYHIYSARQCFNNEHSVSRDVWFVNKLLFWTVFWISHKVNSRSWVSDLIQTCH